MIETSTHYEFSSVDLKASTEKYLEFTLKFLLVFIILDKIYETFFLFSGPKGDSGAVVPLKRGILFI